MILKTSSLIRSFKTNVNSRRRCHQFPCKGIKAYKYAMNSLKKKEMLAIITELLLIFFKDKAKMMFEKKIGYCHSTHSTVQFEWDLRSAVSDWIKWLFNFQKSAWMPDACVRLCAKLWLPQQAWVMSCTCCSAPGSCEQEQTVSQQPFQGTAHSNTAWHKKTVIK